MTDDRAGANFWKLECERAEAEVKRLRAKVEELEQVLAALYEGTTQGGSPAEGPDGGDID